MDINNPKYPKKVIFNALALKEAEKKITGRGGAGRGQGRKEGRTKTTVSITIDNDLFEWYKTFGKLSPVANKILRNHKNHIEQLIKETDQANEL